MAALLWIGNPPFGKLRERHILREATFHYIFGKGWRGARLEQPRASVQRVRPRGLGKRIFHHIEEEYHRSVRAVLDTSGSSMLLAGQHVLAESIRLRNPYVDPLNFLQTRFLERWRQRAEEQRSQESGVGSQEPKRQTMPRYFIYYKSPSVVLPSE